MHIGYLEDDVVDVRSFERLMNKLSEHTFQTFVSLEDAMDAHVRQPFDVLVADLDIPGVVPKSIFDAFVDIPVFILSGYGDLPSSLAGLEKQAVGRYIKPLKVSDMRQILSLAGDKIDPEKESEMMGYIRELSDGDRDFEQEMLGIIYNELSKDLEQLISSFEQKEWAQSAAVMHRLKSKSAMLGKKEIWNTLDAHERTCRSGNSVPSDLQQDLIRNLENMKTSIVSLLNSRNRN